MTGEPPRDHGGGLDAAVREFGGIRSDWLDLSTGINPHPYPIPTVPGFAWNALPDTHATAALEAAARQFWNVPTDASVLAASGASALIARIPQLLPAGSVSITRPTYNEHEAAFRDFGWDTGAGNTNAQVIVNPNNPDGRIWNAEEISSDLVVIDESFCDVTPDDTLIHLAANPGTIVLKSFGKFWGLAGLRLGFAIGDPALIARLSDMLGPWPVSGPALAIGREALTDAAWALETRRRLRKSSERLDQVMGVHGATLIGGTSLFRLYEVDNAQAWQSKLACQRIWSRIFPYSKTWLRLGLPTDDGWQRLEDAL
jgi:cobalamin biosynthetic protein CobC